MKGDNHLNRIECKERHNQLPERIYYPSQTKHAEDIVENRQVKQPINRSLYDPFIIHNSSIRTSDAQIFFRELKTQSPFKLTEPKMTQKHMHAHEINLCRTLWCNSRFNVFRWELVRDSWEVVYLSLTSKISRRPRKQQRLLEGWHSWNNVAKER